MHTSALPPNALPGASAPVPVPLWERHQLFQEPAYPEGLERLEGEEDEDA